LNSFFLYLSIFLGSLLIVSIFYVLRFAMIVLQFQEVLEESLDVIDEKYASISEVCERPLFYDSPEVRRVLKDIKETRDSLHGIAFTLSKDFTFEEDDLEDPKHA